MGVSYSVTGTQQKGVDPEKPRVGQGPRMPVIHHRVTIKLIKQCPFYWTHCMHIELDSWMDELHVAVLVHAAEMSRP